ncbi:MAG TPA: CRISPR-associated endoribonuclease Cas6 [Pseudothermotoga sp.]|uniref:CRISPR-associated endoribonuclease Cas6 n=1 Tax=Thermotoga profunda TaxID=1508420 RepID=UPI0005978ABF|nr:CRISPR-associated endoribonuclease Cas6 [Thermotoga profunda]
MIDIFHSVVIKLKALKDGKYDFYPAQKIHSLFLGLIKKSDEQMAKQLHDEQKEKSFTVSSFLGKELSKPIEIKMSNNYFIRLTVLDEEVFKTMISSLLEKNTLREDMRIGNIDYKIVEILFDKEQSKWADHISVQELFKRQYESNLIKFRFHTPTLFRAGDQHYKYPIPEKIFTSLFRKFNKYSEQKIDQDIEKRFKEITIYEKKTQSRRITLRDFYLEGFIGDVTFKIPEHDSQLIKVANILADFAFYAGVGYKTTMGLGQVEKIPLE